MAIEEIIDRLYGLPLAEFTRARNEAASELRKAGQREAAERVKALRKPTTAAAAVNRLVREHRSEVERFLHAAAVLRDAQFSGKGDLAAARQQEHDALERLTGIGGEAARQSLLAAAVDDDAAQQLLEARLEQELEPRGFGTLLAHARPAPVKPAGAKVARATAAHTKPAQPERKKSHDSAVPSRPAEATVAPTKQPPPERKKPDDSAARARLQVTKVALDAAETEERHARRRWEQTQVELEKARAAVERGAGGSREGAGGGRQRTGGGRESPARPRPASRHLTLAV